MCEINTEIVAAELREIIKEQTVKRAYIVGSFANPNKEVTEDSDVDIHLQVEEGQFPEMTASAGNTDRSHIHVTKTEKRSLDLQTNAPSNIIRVGDLPETRIALPFGH